MTNGFQWRILFAGLSYEAFAEWDQQQWLAAGQPTPELNGFRQLVSEKVLTPPSAGESCPFVEAINDSRKGQSDLSEVLGERVRAAAELLIQGHTTALQSHVANGAFTPQELYRAAVRIIMRLVVILFSESREALLPRDNPIYFNSYSLGGLREQLERVHTGRLRNSHSAYPRLISLFHLIYYGSSHEALTVRAYGGQLFAPGKRESTDGMIRALQVLELGCYEHDVMNDQQVHQILNLLSRTKIRIRQGRQSIWAAAPVDFSSLGSEYIGILYEGLLDFELRQAGLGQPVIFLAVGNQPALPLATLEAMDDKSLKNLLEKMKDTSSGSEDADDESEEKDTAEGDDASDSDKDQSAEAQSQDDGDSLNSDSEGSPTAESDEGDSAAGSEPDERSTARSRAEAWAKRAIEVGKLVTKPRGSMTEEKKLKYAADIDRKARQIITKVVLPGEWYLVRWGGTRKGSGTFYTKPQLAIPTVARTLQPLAYQPVVGDQRSGDGGQRSGDGTENRDDCNQLSGSGGLAAGDGNGNSGLPIDSELSTKRTLRANQPSTPGSSLSAIEHSGGPGPKIDQGVSEPSVHSERVANGGGDTTGDSDSPGLFDADSINDIPGEYIESGKAAKRTDSSPGKKALNHQTTAHQPPTTAHQIPTTEWTPRPPEEILALKVCDPACGSGTFPLNALRYLTEALYESLLHYDRIKYYSDRTVIDLITVPVSSHQPSDHKPQSQDDEPPATYRTLAGELLPCRPEDNDFEARTKAVLRRYIVERCIYGVDLDPLAVELCRLSLWIETLDPRLPFTFLDHKIKCGNSLIGTWFDQFMHYPAMAWMREGGDTSHTRGAHFKKEAWTKAISNKVKDVRKELIDYIDGASLVNKVDLATVQTVHDQAEKALQQIHNIGIHEANERAEKYSALINSNDFMNLKFAFDRWCSIWVWPPDKIDLCPLPLAFYEDDALAEVESTIRELSSHYRFFHWELEFPDVFTASNQGFDAILGNPPWETLQPNSKEFFSSLDPLYRSYGNQEAIEHQAKYFQERAIETEWLRYCASYKELSNWMKYSGSPFGNSLKNSSGDKEEHEFSIGNRGQNSFASSVKRHAKWKQKREETTGYADSDHSFRYQGGGKPYTHKLFLEVAHGLLREGGRLGFIVPSGIYSDHGTGDLRSLFLNQCSWEWLFGFENREGIFDIHRSFKFNPVIIEKGGTTNVIQTAFMRRDMADWEHAEKYVTQYPRERVLQFSPRSKAILEIQSQRDLEVLEKIYSNSVLLGDDGPNGWGIKYAQGDFNMTSDSKLFPPRDQWEERGYRPDEYSRWLKGNWQPRTAGYPAPPGCKRVDIPAGIILSRDGQSWISEKEIANDEFKDKKGEKVVGPAVALPLYQGVMINQLDLNFKRHLAGTGATAHWEICKFDRKSDITSQYLISTSFYKPNYIDPRIAYRRIARTTDTRTYIGTPHYHLPSGDSIFFLNLGRPWDSILASIHLSSYWFDWVVRRRLGGTNLSWYMMSENACAKASISRRQIEIQLLGSLGISNLLSPWWLRVYGNQSLNNRLPRLGSLIAATEHEALRKRCVLNAISAVLFGLGEHECRTVLKDVDQPIAVLSSDSALDPRGFWRIERGVVPECRSTVLSAVACMDLLSTPGLNIDEKIATFLSQNNGEGWQLPETLRLADYGLGHDERAKEHQPVRKCFGERFYDWQLEQDPEESWRECHLHARNLLGPTAYQALLDELNGGPGSVRSVQGALVSEEQVNFQASVQGSDNQSLATDNDFSTDDFELSSDLVPKAKPKRGS